MKVIGKCPKCGKDVKVAFDGKNMYFAKCIDSKCNFKSNYISDNKQAVIDNWNK